MSKSAAAQASSKTAEAPVSSEIPENVRVFLTTLQRRIRTRNVHEIHSMYTGDYVRLSERVYARSAWPSADQIAELVEQDENFLVLYKELYFRHIYRFMQPTMEDRVESFQSYVDLFNLILGLKQDAPEIELPSLWLFDIIDEFIYQFQSFHAFRARKDLSEADIKVLLEEDQHTWSAAKVLHYLNQLVKKASPKDSDKKDDFKKSAKHAEDKAEAVAPVFKALSQFAIIGLCRANCLLADYTTALRVLDPIDLNSKRSPFASVGGAYVSLHYYLTLAYLMLSRYTDAVKTGSGLLLWAGRNAHDNSASGVPRTFMKRVEQVYGLLAIATALAPQRLSETLQTALRDRFGDKQQRMQKLDLAAFEETFLASAPKFIDPSTPSYSAPASAASVSSSATPKKGGDAKGKAADEKAALTKPDTAKDVKGASDHNKEAQLKKEKDKSEEDAPTRLQLRLFLTDVKQRASIPDHVSYLKLCTSISVPKLASFLKTDEESAVQGLLNMKNKTRALRWRGGSPASGTVVSSAELDVAISRDTVFVSEYKAARRFGEFFIRNILQLSRLSDDISQVQTAKN